MYPALKYSIILWNEDGRLHLDIVKEWFNWFKEENKTGEVILISNELNFHDLQKVKNFAKNNKFFRYLFLTEKNIKKGSFDRVLKACRGKVIFFIPVDKIDLKINLLRMSEKMDKYDLVSGSIFLTKKQKYSKREIKLLIFTKILKFLTKSKLTDPFNNFIAIKRDILDYDLKIEFIPVNIIAFFLKRYVMMKNGLIKELSIMNNDRDISFKEFFYLMKKLFLIKILSFSNKLRFKNFVKD